VLDGIEWRLAPGERTGILGVNGAGKSTLLGLIAGTVEATGGRVKRGKTVKVATLTQRLDDLDRYLDDPVRKVIADLQTTYTFGAGSKAQELSPSQLLERLGFDSAQLSTPVKDLSGGQKRRLQLLLILLDAPNVLILDEPTNDLDTDMLAALEDLLDSWPGTLIVVSHDRYFLERATDQQFAVMDGKLRHLPGGVDEFLKLRAAQSKSSSSVSGGASSSGGGAAATSLSGADLRAANKELASMERRIDKLHSKIDAARTALADHDQADYQGLAAETESIRTMEAELEDLEERWMELGESIE